MQQEVATGGTCQEEAAELRLGIHRFSQNYWEQNSTAVAKLAKEETLVVAVVGGGTRLKFRQRPLAVICWYSSEEKRIR